MNNDTPIIYGSDGWYDALTGERINPQRLGKENMDRKRNAAMVGVGPNKSWEQAHDEAVNAVYALALQNQTLQARLDVALKWLEKIASFAGERQHSATETEDFYLKGVHDADTAARKLVEAAKAEIEATGEGKSNE